MNQADKQKVNVGWFPEFLQFIAIVVALAGLTFGYVFGLHNVSLGLTIVLWSFGSTLSIWAISDIVFSLRTIAAQLKKTAGS